MADSDIDEESQAEAEEPQQQQQSRLAELRRRIAKDLRKRLERKVAKQVATKAATTAAASSVGPWILGAIAIVVVVIGLVVFVSLVISSQCKAGGFTGRLKATVATFGVSVYVCNKLSPLQGILNTIDQGKTPAVQQ